MAKFKTIITTVGAAKIAAVLAGTGSIVLDNTAKMAVGDGSGTLPTPNPAQTKLVNEVHRASINKASIDASDPKNIIAELVIPPETGGFWLREMALYDAAGTLLAVGNMAETYKPSLSEGAGRKMVIRMVIAVSEVSAVTITMDTSTVMATQDYVDTEIDKHAKSRNHPDATLTAKGFTQLNNATDSTSETQAATPKAVKTVMDAAKLKAPLNSPVLTGTPLATTAPPGTNTQQLATTAFVRAAIAALINSSPGTLDTLSELAAALGNDANFATTMLNALAGKQSLDATLTALAALTTGANKLPYFTGPDTASQTDLTLVGRDIIGKGSIADVLTYLGLGDGSALPVGVPVPWPLATAPAGWLKYNGAPFDKVAYPKLAAVYPSGVLPDLRGEFIRGWDDGRGVDNSRSLLSGQASDNLAHTHRDNTAGPGGGAGGTPAVGSTYAKTYLATGGYTENNGAWTPGNNSGLISTTSGGSESRPRNIAFNYIVRAA